MMGPYGVVVGLSKVGENKRNPSAAIMSFFRMIKIFPTLILPVLTLTQLSFGKSEVEMKTNASSYEELSLAIEADPKTKDFLEDFLIESPELELKETETTYHIRIVEPDPNIDYKIIEVEPDPNVDYKIRIIEPDGKTTTPKLNAELSSELNKILYKSESEKTED